MVARPHTGFVVHVPGKHRRVAAEACRAVGDQLVTTLPVARVVDAGAQPAIIMLVDWIGSASTVDNLGVGKLAEEVVVDIEGGKAEEHAQPELLTDVQQARDFVETAVKADADPDRVEPGALDHPEIFAPVLLAVWQPFGRAAMPPKGYS